MTQSGKRMEYMKVNLVHLVVKALASTVCIIHLGVSTVECVEATDFREHPV